MKLFGHRVFEFDIFCQDKKGAPFTQRNNRVIGLRVLRVGVRVSPFRRDQSGHEY